VKREDSGDIDSSIRCCNTALLDGCDFYLFLSHLYSSRIFLFFPISRLRYEGVTFKAGPPDGAR